MKKDVATEAGRAGGIPTRRTFIRSAAVAAAGAAAGCATNPATGRRQIMLFGSNSEKEWDRQASPHQFSADFGAVRDPALNAYVDRLTRDVASHSHRPRMPYSARCVNASYVNAYAFPAGSIAVTRGILLKLDNEDQLAALLGHEIAHVAARHAAQRMTKAALIQGALLTTALLMDGGRDESSAIPWVLGLGMVGASLLLAKYSRKDETQADRLGMDYAVRAGYHPDGMVGLMEMLRSLQKDKPWLVVRMFSSHPWSGDRYDDAVKRAERRHAAARSAPLRADRYMDAIASVRRARPVVEAIQQGDDLAATGRHRQARPHYDTALRAMADDYEALLKLANNCLSLDNPGEGHVFASEAKAVYPSEPMALHLCGMSLLGLRRYEEALPHFDDYAALLPGNPYTAFYQGRSLEGLGRRTEAARRYREFLSQVSTGKEADHARARLKDWGYL